MSRILVVDDEEPIRRLVHSYLTDDGFDVEELADGEAAVERMRRDPTIDLIVMDVRMPKLNGVDALREIRRTSDTYVIMLTAATEETDRLIGLSVGADDYITKPFSPREVVARVKAVLRRSRGAAAPIEHAVLQFDGLTIDIDQHTVTRAGEPADLTALQFQLLLALAESPKRVFARHQLIERVWGQDFFGEDRIVDVHIGNLRKALGDDPSAPAIIGTVRGVGYRFIAEPVDR
ncbi:MAG: response regulator transcription factor [Actinomycetota bacterium]